MVMPPDNRPRASRAIKLVLMGIAGAALLYSCTPGMMGGGMGFWPWLWFLGNPFARGPAVTAPATPGKPPATIGQTQPSQRGGFGGSAGEHGSTVS
jgi:hypothetical protein